MTVTSPRFDHTPLAIPVSSLLPPSTSSPPLPISSPSFAVLGPLPPTSALHLALNFLALSDLPEYSTKSSDAATDLVESKETVVIVTGPRNVWRSEIEEEDEEWLREHGGDYGVLEKLKRVDIRSCPSPDHLKLLLNLLSSGSASDTVTLSQPPGLIILWDIARMFMEEMEDDENLPPGDGEKPKGGWKFRPRVSLSDYMDLVSSAKATTRYFTSLRTTQPPSQLIVFEPHLDRLSSLPILRPASEVGKGLATPTREKRVNVKDGLEWLIGDVVGVVELQDETPEDNLYTLAIPSYPDGTLFIRKRLSPHAEYANARGQPGGDEIQVESTGSRWEWATGQA